MEQTPTKLPNFSGVSAERLAFADWLTQLWAQHVGPPVNGQKRQFRDEGVFLRTMRSWMTKRGVAGGPPDPRSLDNWRKGVSLPREQFLEPLLDTMLADAPNADSERQRGRELWQAAEDAKNRSSNAKRRLGSAPWTPVSIMDDAPGESDWKVENTEPLQQGLAELLVHPPPRGGNTPLEFPLQISLSFAEWPDDVENVTLALTDATLIPSYEGCRPVPGTRLGAEERPHENLLFRGGTWRINGPRLSDGHLEGEPFLSDPLCTIQCDGEPGDSLTITLRSGYRSLAVVPNESDVDASVVKQRVLQALLQKSLPRDPEGIVTWGRSVLRRKVSK